ncbi:MAG: bglA 1 [Flavisolibacter sp.]|nr:bglA 1 [Flavisolibacter sp.]
MRQLSVYLVVIAFGLLASCKKESKPAPVSGAPTNLTLTATVNPDNSGNVSFVASATNAVSYEYDFGNGTFQNVSTGSVTYKYPAAGTYTVNVVAKSSGGQTVSKSIQVTITIGSSSSSVVWSDEFNTPGAPDPAKWGYDLGANNGWGNNELEYYTNRPENVIVSNGTLKIITKKETFSGSAYTSARILTKDKFSFKYGKMEVRAKLPSGGGIWPAAWMLGSNINTAPWPACGEIDVMEHVGNQPNKIFGTLHYPGRSGGNADGSTVIIPNVTTEFHRYGLEWSATTIKISVDDAVFYTYVNNPASPFNQNFFIILNTAIGGNFGGAVDPAFTTGTFEIDYVRVYN